MALRLIELVLPRADADRLRGFLADQPVLDTWQQPLAEDQTLVKLLIDSKDAEAILDLCEKHFAGPSAFKIVMLPVEAALPRPEPEKKKEQEPAAAPKEAPRQGWLKLRIGREELYHDIVDSVHTTRVYGLMVFLSALVAAIGLLNDNLAVIIGAMVIAPLLGPNVALALATTLGDLDLARKAIRSGAMGIGIALVPAVALGAILGVDPVPAEIASRSEPGLEDLGLALAAGSAGALAFTTGLPAVLIGVMVAVALLPPVVTAGLWAGAGAWEEASRAFLLFLVNVASINLAGVLTFLLQGIRPMQWWQADRAKRATRTALALWLLLLGVVVGIMFLIGPL